MHSVGCLTFFDSDWIIQKSANYILNFLFFTQNATYSQLNTKLFYSTPGVFQGRSPE